MNTPRPSGLVKSADRTLEILEFCARQRHPVAHAEIAATLSIPKSSVSALLGNMVERDYLTYHPDTNGYGLGAAVIALAGGYLRELDLARLGQASVQALATQLCESAALAILAGNRVQVIARHNWVQPLMYAVHIGDTAPLHASASGKAILAFLSPSRRDAVLKGYEFAPYAVHTLRTRRALVSALESARDAGYARADEELVDGIMTLAAPVFDGTDNVVGAISVSIPTPRVRRYQIAELAQRVGKEAQALSHALGAGPGTRKRSHGLDGRLIR
ncbi:MAG: IclR family transcriptional regulator [Gammaproteobacteria bacterium]|nr:IclR family transcriptional regulator [Gammaproteobacteria bacterium]